MKMCRAARPHPSEGRHAEQIATHAAKMLKNAVTLCGGVSPYCDFKGYRIRFDHPLFSRVIQSFHVAVPPS